MSFLVRETLNLYVSDRLQGENEHCIFSFSCHSRMSSDVTLPFRTTTVNNFTVDVVTNVCLHETVGNAFGKHENELNAEYEEASIPCFSKWHIIDPYTRIMKE